MRHFTHDPEMLMDAGRILLELALESVAIILLHKHIIARVRIDRDRVQGVHLARAVEQVLVHFAVVATQRRVKLPVGKPPRIDQPNGMRPDLLEQVHDRLGPRQLDLPHRDGGGGEELGRLALERVQRMQPEQLVHEYDGALVEFLGDGVRAEGVVEVLHDQVLRVRRAQAPEVDQQVVPAVLVLVPVLERFERQEGGSPGECGDDVFIPAEDVECCSHVPAGEEGS